MNKIIEVMDLYTKDRRLTGNTIRRGEDIPQGSYRLIVHVCIFNSAGELLIQKRQPFKLGWPDLWDLSVGGSAISGDTSQKAAIRETREELGIDIDFDLRNVRPALTINFENGFDDFYLLEKDLELNDLDLQYEEVQEVRWASKEEILEMIKENSFIPWHNSLIELLFYLRNHPNIQTREDDND